MMTTDFVQVVSEKYLETITDALRSLYAEEQLSDVTLHCKEGSLKAHKLILAANSPYFRRIFTENRNEYPIIILHGISMSQLKNLMELLYQGIVDIPQNDIDAVSALVKEFEIKGVFFGQKASNNIRLEIGSIQGLSPDSLHLRDTRFKGQKRVAVDFVYEEGKSRTACGGLYVNNSERPIKRANHDEPSAAPSLTCVKKEVTSPTPDAENNILRIAENPFQNNRVDNRPKLSAWARKQRKFKCDLCPSSFKRSSHLTRHQLVHTGERPYACNQCDKAFSRHDKLKHHMRKNHEYIPDSMYERIDLDAYDEERELDIASRNFANTHQIHNNGSGEPSTSRGEIASDQPPEDFERANSPLFTISHITSILEDSFVTPPKRGRGRPRKYPPVPIQPTTKKGRGRPRLNQGVSSSQAPAVQNYEINDSSFGSLTYRPKDENTSVDEEQVMLEPLVEINTDQNEVNRDADELNTQETMMEPLVEIKTENNKSTNEEVNISEIEAKIGLIGECTISVAN